MTDTLVTRRAGRFETQREQARTGVSLLVVIVLIMWILEAVNAIDSNRLALDDGILPRNVSQLWAIVTAPFLHFSWGHLISNTVPFVFMGAFIALRGAARLAFVTAIVILLGGLGTWLIAPAHSDTVGASGVVFGYATYLLTRGFFNRSALEIAIGAVVGAVWGGALWASLIPQYGISWQGHLCGALAGILAAYVLRGERHARLPGTGAGRGALRTPAV